MPQKALLMRSSILQNSTNLIKTRWPGFGCAGLQVSQTGLKGRLSSQRGSWPTCACLLWHFHNPELSLQHEPAGLYLKCSKRLRLLLCRLALLGLNSVSFN